MNVYAPNLGQAEFLSRLNVVLSEFTADPIFMGGDLNLVCDPVVDRSGRPVVSDAALSAALKELQTSLALSDIWRIVNRHAREYTFYSNAHNSYSRIDYLLLSLSASTVKFIILLYQIMPPFQSYFLYL